MTEKEIQTQCLKWLRTNGFFAWSNFVGPVLLNGGKLRVSNPAKGSPDILAIKEGYFYGIEVKKPGGRLSEHQKDWHAEARRFDARILTVYSVDELRDGLSEYLGLKPLD